MTLKIKDKTGMKFGKLTVISLNRRLKNRIYWNCVCDCGKNKVILGNNLRLGGTESCGCLKSHPSSKKQNLKNKRFGKLIAIVEVGRKRGQVLWECKCDCGGERIISAVELNRGRAYARNCGKCISDIQRFYNYIKESNGCWEWQGNLTGCKGYGRICINGKIIKAHRYSYMIFKDDFDHSLLVCHHCDNPKCVNPEHLFQGTFKDNNQDRKRKGRGRKK